MVGRELEAAPRGADSPMGEHCKPPFQPDRAVSAVFEQVKPLQEQVAKIAYILEPMRRLSELASLFESLRELEVKVRDLAQVLEPMHTSQNQPVRQQFTRPRPLDEQLDQLSLAFGESLSQLATALEPASMLQRRFADLATAFGPAKTLRQEFSALAQSFDRS